MSVTNSSPHSSASVRVPQRANAIAIALGYAATGGLWIVGTQWLLDRFVRDPAVGARIELFKGGLFVAVTALLLGWALDRYFVRDTTEKRRSDRLQALSADVLRILNDPQALPHATARILEAIKRDTGLEAVGIRLRQEMDWPYVVSEGFSAEFVEAENSLAARTPDGEFCLDEQGNIRLECTCGLVLSGHADPANPLFTPSGSAWTNDARPFLDLPAEQDSRLHPRNRCIHAGFQSVALIPIRVDNDIIGLLQMNDRRKDCFTPEMIRYFEGLASSFGVALQRSQEERAVRESQRVLRSLFDCVPESLFMMSPDGEILAANAAFAARFGRCVEECVGSNFLELVPPPLVERRRAWIAEVMGTRKPVVNEEPWGDEWLRHNYTPVLGAKGEVERIVVSHSNLTERKRAEEALRQRLELQDQLAKVAATVPGLICSFRLRPDGSACMPFATPAITDIYGLSAKDVRDDFSPILALIHPDDREQVQQSIAESARTMNPWHDVFRARHPQKGPVWVEGHSVPRREADGSILWHGFVQDVTARKLAEESLRDTLHRVQHLNELLRAIRDVSGFLNRERDREKLLSGVCQSLVSTRGYVTVWIGEPDASSGEVRRLAYAGAGEALPHAPIRWDDSPLGQGPTGTAIRERRTAVFDDLANDPRFAPWRGSDAGAGTGAVASVPLLHQDRLFGVLRVKARRANAFDAEEVALLEGLGVEVARALKGLEDEAERSKAGAALRESEQRSSLALKAVQMGTWEWDLVSGRHIWSETQEAIWGYAPGTFPGTTAAFTSRIHPEDLPALKRSMEQRVKPSDSLQFEFRVIRPDGNVRWLSSHGQYQFDAHRTPVRAMGVVLDITERKRLEEQLRQVQKLEAIGQLAGGVAHDFNNILSAIMMHLGMLQMKETLDRGTRQALKDVDGEARRAAALTQQLLMFSRRSVLAVKPLDLNEVVANLLKMLTRLIGENVKLRFDGGSRLPHVEADVNMTEQVVLNLVVNARDAMPKGGHITITTTAEVLGEQEVGADPNRRPGRFVCLAVSDTGTGMDEATRKRIFEPFFTTKELGKGTGLGLATVDGIVAQHKGWVELQSTLGEGTLFRVFFPAMAEGESPVQPREHSEPLRRGQETILLAEDDAAVRLTMAQTLRALGYRVYPAANGQEAVKLWQAYGSEVDLLLTDMVMPEGMTGLELAEQLQALKPGLKTIISSGYSAEIVQAGVPTKTGVAYLPKPYTTQTLAKAVRDSLDPKR